MNVADLAKNTIDAGIYKLRVSKFDANTPSGDGTDMLTITLEHEESGIQIWDRIVQKDSILRFKWAPLYVALGGNPLLDVDPADLQPFYNAVIDLVADVEYVYAIVGETEHKGKPKNEIEAYLTEDAAEEAMAGTAGF